MQIWYYYLINPECYGYFQIVPILRAGLALADLATSILPSTRTFHLGEGKIELLIC